MTKVALVLTVKNEARILRHNLAYHKAIGAERIFVYFDHTTDHGKKSIEDLSYVTLQDSVASEKYEHLSYLDKFTSQAKEHHTARQCLNTFDALKQCERLGYDWLISLDADELVCTHSTEPSQLHDFFSEISQEVQVVNLMTKEALQQQESCTNVFAETTTFKNTHTYPSRFEKIYKTFYNPFTSQSQRFSFWYGQHLGKGAIRVVAGVIPHNVHRYKLAEGEAIKKIDKGWILHYHAYDANDFIKKFTNFSNRPDTFLSGNRVESMKLLLRDIVNKGGYTKEELVRYYKENLLFSSSEVKKLATNRYGLFFSRSIPPLITITSVKKVFETLPKK